MDYQQTVEAFSDLRQTLSQRVHDHHLVEKLFGMQQYLADVLLAFEHSLAAHMLLLIEKNIKRERHVGDNAMIMDFAIGIDRFKDKEELMAVLQIPASRLLKKFTPKEIRLVSIDEYPDEKIITFSFLKRR